MNEIELRQFARHCRGVVAVWIKGDIKATLTVRLEDHGWYDDLRRGPLFLLRDRLELSAKSPPSLCSKIFSRLSDNIVEE
ncbi:hypothetical protein Q3G72_005443 [Acer saccharum]|nr:hypothetical protein Q3G72_005443 [Acer saccharum]